MSAWSRACASLPPLGEPRKRRSPSLLLGQFCFSKLLVRNALLQLARIERRGRGLIVNPPLALAAATAAAASASAAAASPRDSGLPTGFSPFVALRRVGVIALAMLAAAKHIAGAHASPDSGRHKAARRRTVHGLLRSFVPVSSRRRRATVQHVRRVKAAVLCLRGVSDACTLHKARCIPLSPFLSGHARRGASLGLRQERKCPSNGFGEHARGIDSARRARSIAGSSIFVVTQPLNVTA